MIYKNTSAFTLMEMLISMSLVLIILTVGIHTFSYFSAEAALSRVRETIDSKFIMTNVHALTGKSLVSDYYDLNSSRSFQISRYFLYFEKASSWDDLGYMVYGELQKGIKGKKKDRNGIWFTTHEELEGKEYYELVYLKRTEIEFPIFISDIILSYKNGTADVKKTILENEGLFVFFDSPFAKVSFLPVGNVVVKEKTGDSSFADYKYLYEVNSDDYSHEMYIDIPKAHEKKGQMELVLRYKDRKVNSEPGDENYWLQEYVKYDSKNQLSHYWN